MHTKNLPLISYCPTWGLYELTLETQDHAEASGSVGTGGPIVKESLLLEN